MKVFLIPIGRGGYELYYEPHDAESDLSDEATSGGVFARWRERFSQMLRDAEKERHRAAAEPAGVLGRAHRRMMRFVVERIAEWRLLWHLRRADDLVAHVPPDVGEDEARRLIGTMLKGDGDRHLRWLIVNLILLVAAAPLTVVPGPNIVAYYFTFNVVGHFLAMRGARRGLSLVPWRIEPTPPLADLRAALALEPDQRERTVHDVAARLELQHLARFFHRIAVPTA